MPDVESMLDSIDDCIADLRVIAMLIEVHEGLLTKIEETELREITFEVADVRSALQNKYDK